VNTESIRKAYRRYASHYDALFGPILRPGRQLVVNAMDLRPGDKVLEVGVGTGLSLPMYPPAVRVTGIDISQPMLEVARQRIARDGLGNVAALLEMDAEKLQFADHSFDKVVAMYVMSVVPDPVQVVNEMRRVCRAAGEIFILNHFHSRLPLVRDFERLLSPLSQLAGFRPDMELDAFLRDAHLDVIEMSRANLFGHWKILRCRTGWAPLLSDAYPLEATEL
jgi:phosphatidylethanolamine/phosphatidyl-N-methylethanolamine N-methyltransferase